MSGASEGGAKSAAFKPYRGVATSEAIREEIYRANVHGPNATTIDALEDTLKRAEAAEKDFLQVHENCIAAREQVAKLKHELKQYPAMIEQLQVAPSATAASKDVLGDAEGLWQNVVAQSVGPGNEKAEATTISKRAFIDAICLYEMAQVARASRVPVAPSAWIPVSERLPKKPGEQFVHCSTGYTTILYWLDGEWVESDKQMPESRRREDGYWNRFVTHWQPLPSAPTSTRKELP